MRKSELVRFVVRFTREATLKFPIMRDGLPPTLEAIASDALAILRLASSHKRLCELACSMPVYRENVSWEAQGRSVTQKLAAILKPYGIGLLTQGDPRGCTVRLNLPSGYSDHPEGGFCIPQNGLTSRQLDRMS